MSEYEVNGEQLFRRAYPWEEYQLAGWYGSNERAVQEKAKLEASDALFSTASRAAWQRLLRETFPTAELCNCRAGLYGCKYGCDWNLNRTKEAVAAAILEQRRLSVGAPEKQGIK